jgi:glycosyltransferase involved in cell wall biosynthesis
VGAQGASTERVRVRADESATRPVLTVVVPVYNGGEEIVENVGVIRRAAAGVLAPEQLELVVVSDGSIDGTSERLLEARSDVNMRVIHYDRNLGKGYAVKLGALAARGRWIAVVDADLDLDPAAIPRYLEVAEREALDFAIGSKRHPASLVYYPRSRRIASWGYQQLNRLLFQLDVRDTQVGLKVFRREIADEVVPLLLVKEFAFDLELLAVARALGFRRVRELPVHLEYRFTGSEVRSRAVARALWDTAAVFYRLRLLRTYQRKRHFLGAARRSSEELPLVTVVGELDLEALDYPRLEAGASDGDGARAEGATVAVLGGGARPAGNWISATVPYLLSPEVAAVVVPTVAPPDAPVRERAAAAILESHVGGGSRRPQYLPGNVRVVADYPTESIVLRRPDFTAASRAGVARDELVAWLAERGRRTVYTPDTMLAGGIPRLFGPHLQATWRHGVSRGAAARRTRGSSVSVATTISLLPVGCGVAGMALAGVGSGETRRIGTLLVAGYGAVVAGSAALAALRTRSAAVGALAAPGLVATQAAYVAGFVRGLARSG